MNDKEGETICFQTFVDMLVLNPYFNLFGYCSLGNCTRTFKETLKKLQNSDVRLITGDSYVV